MAPEGIEGLEEVHPGILPSPGGPSMHNGTATTMPPNMTTPQINGSNQPIVKPDKSELVEPSKTCRISIMLVSFILSIGLAVSILGVYMHMTTPISVRDCVIWAGVPVSSLQTKINNKHDRINNKHDMSGQYN